MPRRSGSHEEDEEAIGSDGTSGIQWRVQGNGAGSKYQRSGSVASSSGSVIRVSVGPSHGKKSGVRCVSRLLAFVDPLTGKLVVRMGMWDVSRSTKGHEVGPQVVWESDVPVCKVDGRDDV